MALGRGRPPEPGCDRPPLPPPPPERITSRNSFFSKAVHDDGKDLAGDTVNDKTAPTTPRTNRPEAAMGPKLPTVTEAARQMWSMVTIRSVAPDGHAPGAMIWDDSNVAIEADVVPSNTTESCACLCSRVPLHPLRPWRDEVVSRHWWGCGCVDYGLWR
jgi:hypothetical protein